MQRLFHKKDKQDRKSPTDTRSALGWLAAHGTGRLFRFRSKTCATVEKDHETLHRTRPTFLPSPSRLPHSHRVTIAEVATDQERWGSEKRVPLLCHASSPLVLCWIGWRGFELPRGTSNSYTTSTEPVNQLRSTAFLSTESACVGQRIERLTLDLMPLQRVKSAWLPQNLPLHLAHFQCLQPLLNLTQPWMLSVHCQPLPSPQHRARTTIDLCE